MPITRIFSFLGVLTAVTLLVAGVALAAPFVADVQVSDVGNGSNTLTYPNTNRMVATAPDGTIYVAYHGPAAGIRVARSTDRGATFSPSVQLTTQDALPEIGVDRTGIVYVIWVYNGSTYLCRSTDRGQTFSAPTYIGIGNGEASHLALDAPYVYVISKSGRILLSNANRGVGPFTTNDLDQAGENAEVFVDPRTHAVYLVLATPTLVYRVSTDHGQTFSSPVTFTGQSVSYASASMYAGAGGPLFFVAGLGTRGYRIDATAATNTALTFGNAATQSRCLASDNAQTVVDGYYGSGGIYYKVSRDLGATFEPAVRITNASFYLSLALNRATGDLDIAYVKNGIIYFSAYNIGFSNSGPTAGLQVPSPVEQSFAGGATVTLDASTSTDPESDPLTYKWDYDNDGTFDATGMESTAQTTYNLGTHTAKVQISDVLGVTATATATFTVVDTTAPSIAVSPVTVEQADGAGTAVTLGSPTVSDICDAAPSVSNDAPAVFPLGTTTVTWTATDASGNSRTATQAVTVEDTTDPEVTAPADILAEQTSAAGTPVALGTPTVTDICDAAPAMNNDAPAVFPLGDTTVTWTIIDASGNTTTVTQTVTIVDTTAPALTAPAAVTVEQADAAGTAATLGSPTIADLCDAAPTVSHDAPAVFPLGATTVTWTATDASGNQATATQQVVVEDTTAPTATAPADVIVEQTSAAGTSVDLGEPVVSDSCDAAPAVTNDAPAVFPLGDTTVTWTITDASGNVTTVTQLVTIVDTTDPAATAPADITTEQTSAAGTPVTLGTPVVSDICDTNPAITNDAPAVFPLGETTVTWTITDASGNDTTVTQTVTVEDTTAPDVDTPADITAEQTSAAGTPVDLGDLVIDDICDAAPAVTNDAPAVFPLGDTTVTWTVTDASGNVTTVSHTVTVVDTTAPTVTAPADVTTEQTSAAGTPVTLGTPTVTDICDASPTVVNDAPAVFPLGDTTVTWTVTDASGNVTTVAQTVSIIDTTAPAATAPADILAEQTAAAGTPVALGTPTVTDICDAAPAMNNDAPAVFPLGDTMVTWTITDASGNETLVTQTVTIVDTTAPQVTAPADITAEQTAAAGTPVTLGTPTVVEICDASPTVVNDAPAVFPLGDTTVTWTVTDASGNVTTVTQTVTIEDTTAPVVTAPSDIIAEQTSGAGTPVTLGTPTVTDICDATPNVVNDAPAVFPLGDTTVTWTVTDASGNVTTVTQLVTIEDTTAPVVTAPVDITTEQTSAAGTPVTLGTPAVSDICDATPNVVNDAPAVFPLGDTTVTWTVTDASGNVTTVTQTVTIEDTTAPVVTAPADVTTEQTSAAGTPVALGTPVVSDICDAAPAVTNDAPAVFPLGDTTVTWTVTDASGNETIVTQLVTIIDTTAPAVTAPVDVTTEQTSAAGTPVTLGTPTVSDICDASPTVVNNAPAVFPLGDTTVTWTVTDASGNVTTVTQTVTIEDTTAPVVTAPADIVAEQTAAAGTPVALGTPDVDDICDANPAVTNDAPAVFPLGDTTVTWTVTDASGNVTTVTQLVTIVDTTDPAVTAPADVTTEQTSAAGTPATLGTPTVSDICDASPTVVNDAPAVFPLGDTTVTWTVTDASGNVTTVTQTVTIIDTTAPVVTAPSDIIAEQTSAAGTPVTLGTPTVSDICDAAPAVTNDAPAVFPLGDTTVTWTVTDASGNITTVTQTVTIVDTTAPTATAPTDITTEQTSAAGTPVTLGTPTVTDICDASPTVVNDAPVVFPLGDTTVTWTITDASGNVTTVTQEVTIEDTTAPDATAPADVTAEQTSAAGTPVDLGEPVVSDICDANPTVVNDAPAVFPLGDTTVTWTITDASGNVTTVTQTVSIIDTTAPVVTAPADVTAEQANAAGTPVSLGTPDVDDICDAAPAVTNDAPAVFPLGDTTVTWTVTDASGNETVVTQQVTIIDTTVPTITAPSDITAEQSNRDGTPVDLGEPVVSDICDATPAVTNDAPAVFPLGDTTVTWTITDASGNVTTATQTVTIIDTTAPTIDDTGEIVVEQTNRDGTPVQLAQPAVTDICDASPALVGDAPATFPLGDTTVTWMATDASGNVATAMQTVRVVDTTPPAVLSVVATPRILPGPRDGHLEEVTVTLTASDICDVAPTYRIVSVSGNEDVTGDWEITGAHTVKLRNQHDAPSTGRIYTIHLECIDASGNVTPATVDVYVPTIEVADVTGTRYTSVALSATLYGINGLPLKGKALTFYVDGVRVGSSLTNSAGLARMTYAIGGKPVGAYTIWVTFAGDSDNPAMEGYGTLTVKDRQAVALYVIKSGGLGLSTYSASVSTGSAVQLTAMAKDATGFLWDVSGEVQWNDYGSPVGAFTGSTYQTVAPGTAAITASYGALVSNVFTVTAVGGGG